MYFYFFQFIWSFIFLATIKKNSVLADKTDEYVVSLTESTFQDFVKNEEFTIVEFFAPWCGHCKRLAPEYEAAAKALSADNIKLAKVDATIEKDLASKFDIRGYPTLKAFRKGVPEEYTGGRTSDTIVQWVKSMTGPALKKVDSMEKAKEEGKNSKFAVIGTFVSESSEAFIIFQKVAEKSRATGKFVYIIDPKASQEEVTAIRLSEGKTHSIKVTDETILTDFINLEKLPLFGPIDTSNYGDYFGSGRDIGWFIGNESDFQEAASAIRQAALPNRSKLNFVWLDSHVFKDHAEGALGVKEFPALVVQTKTGRFYYKENDMKSAEKIIKFCDDLYKGKLEATYMSEEIPEDTPEIAIKTVVGKTLKDTLFSEKDNVFLMVYDPHCEHCKRLKPHYKKFAELLKDKSDIVIAEMDGSKNESPIASVAWHAYPTIFFCKAGCETPEIYDGEHTLDGLKEYLNNQIPGTIITVEPSDEL